MLSVARCAVTLLTLQFTLQWGVVQGQSFAPIKLVAIGVPVASHWFQLEAIIEGVLARGHQVKVSNSVQALRALSRCATILTQSESKLGACQPLHTVPNANCNKCTSTALNPTTVPILLMVF